MTKPPAKRRIIDKTADFPKAFPMDKEGKLLNCPEKGFSGGGMNPAYVQG
jgi:hypothetical protein